MAASLGQTLYIVYVDNSEKSDGCQQEMESYKSTLNAEEAEVQKNETIQTHKYSI